MLQSVHVELVFLSLMAPFLAAEARPAKVKHCSVLFVYDDLMETWASDNRAKVDVYLTDIVRRTNLIYRDQAFGGLKIQFYVSEMIPIKDLLCKQSRFPDLCKGNIVRAKELRTMIARIPGHRQPIIFAFISPRQYLDEKSQVNFALTAAPIEDRAFGICDNKIRDIDVGVEARGNTALLSTDFGHGDFARMAIQFAHEFDHALGMLKHDTELEDCEHQMLMDDNPNFATAWSECSIEFTTKHLKSLTEGRVTDVGDCLEDAPPGKFHPEDQHIELMIMPSNSSANS